MINIKLDSLVSAENIYRGAYIYIHPKIPSFRNKTTLRIPTILPGKVLEAVLAGVFGQFYEGVRPLRGDVLFLSPARGIVRREIPGSQGFPAFCEDDVFFRFS